MDPFTMCLLIGVFLSVGGRTVANGVTDAIATAKGKTPPSQEKWQKKQDARKARGEKPERKPGLIRMWWRNAAEAAATKAAHKQQGRRDFLAEHGDKIAAKQKEKLERSAARRELVGQKLAEGANISWAAAKDGAAKAKDKLKRAPADDATAEPAGKAETSPDTEPTPDGKEATVLPFRRTGDADGEEASQPGEARKQTGCLWIPPATRKPCGKTQTANTDYCTEHHAIGKLTECNWGSRNPDIPRCGNPRLAHQPFCAEHLQEFERRTQTPEAAPDLSGTRSPAERALPGTNPVPAPEVPEGEPMATNTSTEITSLDTAIGFGEDSAKYTSTVIGEMADLPGLIETFAKGCTAEAQAYENAASQVDEAFRGDSKAQAQFTAAAEALNAAAEALKTAATKVGEASEETATANGAMKTLVKFFTDKIGTREAINAEKENGGAAKSTDWYTN